MRPFRVEAPISPLVPYETPEGLSIHCHTDTDDEKELIKSYERAAVGYLDGYSGRLGRCILRQKWALPIGEDTEIIMLPFPDCRDFSVEFKDDTGAWHNVENVTFKEGYDCISLYDLPEDKTGLSLICVAGWENSSEVPENLKQAVKMLVAHWYINRSAVAYDFKLIQVPMAVEELIKPYINIF